TRYSRTSWESKSHERKRKCTHVLGARHTPTNGFIFHFLLCRSTCDTTHSTTATLQLHHPTQRSHSPSRRGRSRLHFYQYGDEQELSRDRAGCVQWRVVMYAPVHCC
ncbi:unnamed protein product, partial [Ectocarpus sp. 13 AM-2016]